MNDADELSQFVDAERAEAPSAGNAARGWRDLQWALQDQAPALTVAHGPLKLGLSVATKSFVASTVIAFGVTTAGLGVHAMVVETPKGVSIAPSAARPNPSGARSAAATISAPSASTTAPQAPASSAKASSTLAQELRLIKAAKLELDAGRPHLAKVWLDEHAERYPFGVLRREREELRQRLLAQPDENRHGEATDAK